jgi:hypothetical protein
MFSVFREHSTSFLSSEVMIILEHANDGRNSMYNLVLKLLYRPESAIC